MLPRKNLRALQTTKLAYDDAQFVFFSDWKHSGYRGGYNNAPASNSHKLLRDVPRCGGLACRNVCDATESHAAFSRLAT